MTIRTIVADALRTQVLAPWQEKHIQTLLICRRFNEEDVMALAQLTEAMIAGKVSKEINREIDL